MDIRTTANDFYGTEVTAKVGNYNIQSLVLFKPIKGDASSLMVNLFMGLDNLSNPIYVVGFPIELRERIAADEGEVIAKRAVENFAPMMLPILLEEREASIKFSNSAFRKKMNITSAYEHAHDLAFEDMKLDLENTVISFGCDYSKATE